MTKQEIIKQEILGIIFIPTGAYNSPDFSNVPVPILAFGQYACVDIDKLSVFLAKYIDIKIDKKKM